MKLWDKGKKTDKLIENFTVGNDRELDMLLAKYDVIGSIAHAKMLHKIGLLTEKEVTALVKELNKVADKIEQGKFSIEKKFEDIHSKIEYELTKALGDTGKKIHTGRSRNDQVMVDIHLLLKDEIADIKNLIQHLFDSLLTLSEKHKTKLLPGYTHLQIAMPSSFGLWFGGHAECLIDDIYSFNAAYSLADQNPLGSAAGYGSSFPIDREMTTKLLGFKTLKYNSTAVQLSRGKTERQMANAMASAAFTLTKLSMDICLFMNQNFAFISFPEQLTTGSSIMPHKKNPDVFELIRAKCNKIQSLPFEISMITANLPGGYHRDFQILKEALFPAINTLKVCLQIADFSLQQIRVNTNILEDPKYDLVFSVESVNEKVMEGKPFREAYREVGEDIEQGKYKANRKIKHTHTGSINNLCTKEIRKKFKAAFTGV